MGMGPMLLIGVKTCNFYDRFVLCLAGLDKPSRERVNPQLVGINTVYVQNKQTVCDYINQGSKSSGTTTSPVSSQSTVFIRSPRWSRPCQCPQSR